MSSPQFTADHQGFYLNEVLFYPTIQEESPLAEWSNTGYIRLPSCLSDDLDWSEEIKTAHEYVAIGKNLLWEIDLRLSSMQFIPEDSASFYSFALALEEFSKVIWPLFQNQTFGVVLYRGEFNVQERFPLSLWESRFLEWQDPSYDLFCSALLSEYLHRLVSFLPDTTLPFAMIDVASVDSPTKTAQLFSKERFEHIHLILKGAKAPFSGIVWENGGPSQGYIGHAPSPFGKITPATIGIYLPKDSHMSAEVIETLDQLVSSLQREGKAFRFLTEEKMTEEWDGIDELMVVQESVSAQGRRKLLGFAAAGGEIKVLQFPAVF